MSIHFDHTPVFDSGADDVVADIALLGENTYAVLAPDRTLGYVEKVGAVFVGLAGDELPHAVEIGQSLSFDVTVAMVMAADRRRRRW